MSGEAESLLVHVPPGHHLPLPTSQTPHALSQEQQGPTQGSPRSGCSPKLSRAQGTAPSAPWTSLPEEEAMAGEQHWHPHVVTGIRVSSQPKSALQRGILLTRTTSGPTPAAPCPSYAGDPQRWKQYYRGIL